MHNMDFQHQFQDHREAIAEQIMAQFERQAEMERRLEHARRACARARSPKLREAAVADLVLPEDLGGTDKTGQIPTMPAHPRSEAGVSPLNCLSNTISALPRAHQ
jgi:hypothetical protein